MYVCKHASEKLQISFQYTCFELNPIGEDFPFDSIAEINIQVAAENHCLENDISFWDGIFSGATC